MQRFERLALLETRLGELEAVIGQITWLAVVDGTEKSFSVCDRHCLHWALAFRWISSYPALLQPVTAQSMLVKWMIGHNQVRRKMSTTDLSYHKHRGKALDTALTIFQLLLLIGDMYKKPAYRDIGPGRCNQVLACGRPGT